MLSSEAEEKAIIKITGTINYFEEYLLLLKTQLIKMC